MDFVELTQGLMELPFHINRIAVYDNGVVRTHRFHSCANCQDSYSVAKAFVMTAVGMLYDDGLLSLHTPVTSILPDAFAGDVDIGWRLVTIEHVLTHRVGFAEGFPDIDSEDVSRYPTHDYLAMVAAHPVAHMPGSTYVYSDAAYYLLSRIISRVAGMNVDDLLSKRLLMPMGFREVAWSRCPMGYPIGATGLFIPTEDMLKLGVLYLNGGVYEGRRYLSKEWVDLALEREYEFHAMIGSDLIGKGGMYGQLVAFSREKNVAVACHSHEEGDTERLVRYLERALRDWGRPL